MKKEPALVYFGEFDYLPCPVKCLSCGWEVQDTAKDNLQTYAREDPKGEILQIGGECQGFSDAYYAGSYYHFSESYDPMEFSFCDSFECPNCAKLGWVISRTRNGKLELSNSVKLTQETILSVDLFTMLILQLFPIDYFKKQGTEFFKLYKENKDRGISEILSHAEMLN